mmetsp:Transcript_42092/g.102217  ORF Transcript_42092/g.102217 Transcript_42092/m.102217 type:complete len:85 (-) Transcript_42092:325-579(-)
MRVIPQTWMENISQGDKLGIYEVDIPGQRELPHVLLFRFSDGKTGTVHPHVELLQGSLYKLSSQTHVRVRLHEVVIKLVTMRER